MRSVPAIAVSPALELRTYLQFLENAGVPWKDLARRVGLPQRMPAAESFLPTHLCSQLVGELVVREDFAELSARAALAPDGRLQLWQPMPAAVRTALAAPSLYLGLKTFSERLKTSWSHISIWLHETREALWVCTLGPPWLDTRGSEQHVQARTGQIVAMIEQYLGIHWRPRVILLETRHLPSKFLVEIMDGARFIPGAGYTALPVPKALLARSGPRPWRTPDLQDELSEDIDASGWNWLQRLQVVMPEYVLGGQLSVDSAARIAGIHARTLQRALADHGLTFRELVDHARYDLARQMLAESTRSVTEISNLLGYSEPTNFARAFRRVSGRTPSDYRMDIANTGAHIS